MEYLSDEQVRELIIKIKSGDEKAWELVYENFKNYVDKRAGQRLKGIVIKTAIN